VKFRRSQYIVMALCLIMLPACAPAGEKSGETQQESRGQGDLVDPYQQQREEMVWRQIAWRGIDDPAVLAAMREVPRHEFVLPTYRDAAYEDHPLPIGMGQTISQPYIVALMTAALHLRGGEKVLELGTGSGYQAAVLACIADSVYTIEYFEELAGTARSILDRLGYDQVYSRAGDGWVGWAEQAPFDAAMVNFAAPSVPPALAEQLRPGGRICIPIGEPQRTQKLMVFTKQADGSLSSEFLCAVRFVPVQGAGAE